MPARYIDVPKAVTGGGKVVVDLKGNINYNEDTIKRLNEQSIPYLPAWNKNEKYEPYEFVEYHDPALRADKSLPNLFPTDSKYEVSNISPKLGTEIKGIQLSQLNAAAKDELALLAAQREVLVFRDQDFISKGPEYVTDYVRHYGELHIHPTSGAPKNYPDIHSVLTGNTDEDPFQKRTNLVAYHSDVSYELNPTAVSFLAVTNSPKEGGGDTVFSDNIEAYKRLSPLFREKLDNLYAIHSAVDQANLSVSRGGVVKRLPVESKHPIIRSHVATGQKILYVNKGFTRRIEGLKIEESDYLLNFLYDHVTKGLDFQIRVNWKPNTVVVFDNRIVSHSAILDFNSSDENARLIVRIAAKGERPVHDLEDLNKPDKSIVYEGPEYLGKRLEKLNI
ncbi:unnamed protein product [Candida verbasci]|uniref:TauD/TfdA-like domain-containing protein n=1 Tax=Candida verbasci TaxID=1227364 RepID=A0A9W4TXI1_9ASCO|nr:unnamed protein product [Candida verbasci]